MSDSNEFFVFENQHHSEFQVYTLTNLKDNQSMNKNGV